ncbi:MAG: putative baseplate assembly protein, partial [Burkholderiales bacterium]
MATQFRCKNERRRQVIREHGTLNGIDYLEVFDQEAIPIASPRQRTLLLRFLKNAPTLKTDNIEIAGGVRVTPVRVLWVHLAPSVPVPPATNAEQTFFAALPDAALTLVIRTDSEGDFSTYRLRLKDAANAPLSNLDPVLIELDFSFKVECPSDFDCRVTPECPTEQAAEPAINYLAKDYASFRRLMLDRLAVTMPDWQERSPADIGIALVELLAYTADHLSYFQDAVATEAYLGTARNRVSVRRHARLLDYFVHEGCNARTWVCFEVKESSGADGFPLDAGTQLVTGPLDAAPTLDSAQLSAALRDGALVFETRHPLTLAFARNRIAFHTWSDEECCLPKGATRATLHNDPATGLAIGDVLILEEVLEPTSGDGAGADPAHRHAVRLTLAKTVTDPVDGTPLLEIEWAAEDALPFPLCLSSRDSNGAVVNDVSVARGNVVLVDHGTLVAAADLVPKTVPEAGRYRPHLAQAGATFAQSYDHVTARGEPAGRAVIQDPRQVLPWVELSGDGATWTPRRDLLGSDRFASEFVLEVESDGTGYVRFGDDVLGKRPSTNSAFTARYRVGNGSAGNVGRESI